MTTVDRDFSRHIRENAYSSEGYNGPLVTETEIDTLLSCDWMNWLNPNYPTKLAEAIIYRSTGLNPDLAVQGAACVAMSPTNNYQEHASFSVSTSKSRMKKYSADEIATGKVPKISPNDVNTAVKSIDFSQSRPRGTLLDGLRLDSKDSIAESCFINQVTVLQALNHWGVDITAMIDFVNSMWDITYTEKLISDVALAKVEDLENYIATGGRPPPMIYISPNVVSAYAVISSPMITSESLSVSGLFYGRFSALTKFVIATINLVHGKGTMNSISMSINGSQLSEFFPSSLRGLVMSPVNTPSVSQFSSSIPGINSYESFISNRQTMKVALKVERLSILKDISLAIKSTSPLDSFPNTVIRSSNKSIMSNAIHLADNIRNRAEEAAPSKISTILYGIFHIKDKYLVYGNSVAACGVMCLWGSLSGLKKMDPDLWEAINSVKKFKEILKGVNMVRAKEITGMEEHMSQSDNPVRAALIYLFARSITLSKMLTVNSASITFNWYKTGVKPTAIPSDGRFWVGGIFRYFEAYCIVAGRTYNLSPYSHYVTSRSSVFKKVGCKSILRVPLNAVIKAAEEMELWETNVSTKKVLPSTANAARVRHLFAHLRNEWTDFYNNKSSVFVQLLSMANKMESDTLIVELDTNTSKQDIVDSTKDNWNYLCSGILVEWCICIGKLLAFKFANIKLNVPEFEEKTKDFIHHHIDAYKNFIERSTITDISKSVTVDMKMGRWKSDSHLAKAANSFMKGLEKAVNIKEPDKKWIKKLIVDSYEDSYNIVTKAIIESMTEDFNLTKEFDVNDKVQSQIDIAENEKIAAPIVDFNLDLLTFPTAETVEDPPIVKNWKKWLAALYAASYEVESTDPALASLLRAVYEHRFIGASQISRVKDADKWLAPYCRTLNSAVGQEVSITTSNEMKKLLEGILTLFGSNSDESIMS